MRTGGGGASCLKWENKIKIKCSEQCEGNGGLKGRCCPSVRLSAGVVTRGWLESS